MRFLVCKMRCCFLKKISILYKQSRKVFLSHIDEFELRNLLYIFTGPRRSFRVKLFFFLMKNERGSP